MDNLGKWLVIVGLGIATLGVFVWLAQSVGIRFGRLPGDILIQRDGFTVFVPITSMILLSVIATLVLWIVSAVRR